MFCIQPLFPTSYSLQSNHSLVFLIKSTEDFPLDLEWNSNFYLWQVIWLLVHMPFVVVELLSHIWLFATPWTVAVRPLSPWNFQPRILECIAISYSERSSWSRHWTCISLVSCIAGGYFTTSSPGKPSTHVPYSSFFIMDGPWGFWVSFTH